MQNSYSPNERRQYICKACGRSGVVNPEEKYSGQEKEKILKAYFERLSIRGIQRVFSVSRPTASAMVKKACLES